MFRKTGFLMLCFSAAAAGAKWTQGIDLSELQEYAKQYVANDFHVWHLAALWCCGTWGAMYASAHRIRNYLANVANDTTPNGSTALAVCFAPITAPFFLVAANVAAKAEENKVAKV